jgi:DedD protein
VYSQKVATKDGERFRIRIGPVGSRDEADRIRARLAKMGLNGTVQPA